MKNDSLKTLGERLKHALAHHSSGPKTQAWLREKLGVSQAAVSQWSNDQQTPKQLHKIAEVLDVDYYWLSNGTDRKIKNQDDFPLPSTTLSSMGQISFGPDMIPILGHANASSSAIMLNHEDPIGEAPRHPNQKGVRNAFYLKIYDESMAPRYYPGERAAVNGGSMPLTKEDCIIEMNNGEAYIKQFLRTSTKDVVCRQLNPDKEWKRPLSEVKAIHAVVGRG